MKNQIKTCLKKKSHRQFKEQIQTLGCIGIDNIRYLVIYELNILICQLVNILPSIVHKASIGSIRFDLLLFLYNISWKQFSQHVHIGIMQQHVSQVLHRAKYVHFQTCIYFGMVEHSTEQMRLRSGSAKIHESCGRYTFWYTLRTNHRSLWSCSLLRNTVTGMGTTGEVGVGRGVHVVQQRTFGPGATWADNMRLNLRKFVKYKNRNRLQCRPS